jgi:type IV secretion system protein VirB3
MDTGTIETNPLFLGLTRPTLFLGVSILFAMANLVICMMFFINSASLKVIGVAGIIHLIGYLICFKEPLFMELAMVKSQKCNKARKNYLFHGANSYDLY